MPVFTRFQDGVLLLTVDGDYTSNELRRVAFAAFEAEEIPTVVPVLLDMSGAAGLAGKSQDAIRATGAIFSAFRDRIKRLGVVVSAGVADRFDQGNDFAVEAGVPTRSWHSHADARAWLSADEGADVET
jgi:hypothetical protein